MTVLAYRSISNIFDRKYVINTTFQCYISSETFVTEPGFEPHIFGVHTGALPTELLRHIHRSRFKIFSSKTPRIVNVYRLVFLIGLGLERPRLREKWKEITGL